MTSKLVLLHGFTGGPASWNVVRAHLPGDLDVHCPALLGHAPPVHADDEHPGEPRAISGFDEEVDRIARLVRDWAAGESVHVVGYSLGGRVALGLLIRHPGLATSATLIGAHPGLERAGERTIRKTQDERRARQLRSDGLQPFLADWERLPLFASQSELPADVLETQRALRASHDPRGLARSLRVLGLGSMPERWSVLSHIGVPVELIVGARDARFLSLARRMEEKLSRGRLVVVDGAGHNVPLERPVVVARHIERAIRNLSVLA